VRDARRKMIRCDTLDDRVDLICRVIDRQLVPLAIFPCISIEAIKVLIAIGSCAVESESLEVYVRRVGIGKVNEHSLFSCCCYRSDA